MCADAADSNMVHALEQFGATMGNRCAAANAAPEKGGYIFGYSRTPLKGVVRVS